MNLAMIPEGPLAFDGKNYLYSEGEGLYIDGFAGYFEEIIICAYAFHKGEPGYETACNYHFKSSNLRFIELPHWSAGNAGIFSKFMQFVRVCKTIWANIRNWDVIYLFLPGFPAAFAYLINKFFHKKYFVYLASEWSEEAELLFPWEGIKKKLFLPFFSRFSEWIEKKTVKGSFMALTAGRATYEKYYSHEKAIYETIPRLNWQDMDIFLRDDTCLSWPVKLLYVGYLLPRKGVKYLLEAVSIIKNRGEERIVLSIVGTGPQRDELEEHAHKSSLCGNVKFFGHIANGPDLFKKFKESDIFIFPTYSGEGFPRVLYEAMSQSIPVITTNVCGIPYKMIHEENALIVQPESSEAIADAIERLVSSRELRMKIIKNGQKFMQALLEANADNQVYTLFKKHFPGKFQYSTETTEK